MRGILTMSIALCACRSPAKTVAHDGERISDRGADAARNPSFAGEPGVAPAGQRWLAAAGRTTCVVHERRVWCFGDPVATASYGHNPAATSQPRVIDGLGEVVSIAMSRSLACALRGDGSVWCWGVVDDGTLGKQEVRKRPVYVPREITKPEAIASLRATAIDVGQTFGCAIRPERDVVCWGTNESLELGRAGKGSLGPTPVPGVANALEIRASNTSACARVASGEVWCWGTSPTLSKPAPHPVIALAGASRLAVEEDRFCAIRGGQLECLHNSAKETIEGMLEPDAVEAVFGSGARCARRRDGSVTCTGGGTLGQLGDGTVEDDQRTAIVSTVRDAVELAAGTTHFCVRERAGTIRCWGANEAGQAGQPVRVQIAKPVAVAGITDATQVAMARGTGCALRRDGSVACWGGAAGGALGDGRGVRDRASIANVAGLPPAIALAGGGGHFCALAKTGTVSCWGQGGRRRVCDVSDDECAKLGVIPGLTDAIDLSAFRDATCAVRRTGGIVCWGSEHDIGEQTPNPPKNAPTPVIGIANAVRVFVGYMRACAVRRDGSAACWGDNVSFELAQRPQVKARIAEVSGSRDWLQIGRGQPDHALSRTGELRAFDWGNSFERAPPLDTLRIAPPVKTVLTDAVQLAQDFYRTCARQRSGAVSCWDAPEHVTPTGIVDAIDVALSEGGAQCVVRKSGEVMCWGENQHDECGVESDAIVATPTLVTGAP